MIDDRILNIISEEDLRKINNLNILIVGVGGVGGYALESLVRSGVKKITIIDKDKIDESNLNRQIISLRSNILSSKVLEAKKRMELIRDDVIINSVEVFLNEENVNDYLSMEKYDYIVDACDTITVKAAIIKYAKENNLNVISCMGTGNRFNPEELTITKLKKTYNDPLSKALRKILKDKNIDQNVDVVWSKELPVKTKTRTPGSMIFVPATAGLLISSYIIRKELKL